MANQTFTYIAQMPIQASPCKEVWLCLTDAWEAKTVSGKSFVKATISQPPRVIGSPLGVLYGFFYDVRNRDRIQYTLTVDDTQITDPVADVLTCADVVEIFPYGCVLTKLLEYITGAEMLPVIP